MKKSLLVVLAVAILVAAGGYLYSQRQQPPLGVNAGPDFFEALRLNGGVSYGSVLSTSTLASMTLKVSDVQNIDTVVVSPTGANSAKTLTFFASSTAKAWLPKAGHSQTTCFVNATTTSGVNIDFAEGTGVVLLKATSTAGGIGLPTIAPNNVGCFKFIRASSTASTFDIYAAFVEYKDAD